MPQRSITTFATAIAFGILASNAIAAPEQQQAAAAGSECHAAPKGVAPQGAHWYYRTNRATGKKCWYLADEVAKPKKATTTASTQSDDSTDPAPKSEQKTDSKTDKSVADARAEIPADSKPAPHKSGEPKADIDDQSLSESVWPALPDKSETTTAAGPSTAPDETNAFASRWPDRINTSASPDAQALLARKQAEQQQAAAQPQPAPPSTVGRASTPTPTAPTESSVSTLGLVLSVLAGLLALAAIIGPAVFRRIRPQRASAPRRGIWDDVDNNNPPVPWDAEQAVQNDNQPHDLQDLNAQNDELQKILRRAAKRSAA